MFEDDNEDGAKSKATKKAKSKKAKSKKAKSKKKDEYRRVFDEVDVNGDGMIDHDEGEFAIVHWGVSMTEKQFQHNWDSIEKEDSSIVVYDEFKQRTTFFITASRSRDCSFSPTKATTNPAVPTWIYI